MIVSGKPYRTIWMEGSVVRMIDQLALPHFFRIVDMVDHRATAEAICNMTVRGAGAIGAAGGYGVAQAALEAPDGIGFASYVAEGAERLRSTRPTAQDLFRAIDRVVAAVQGAEGVEAARAAAAMEAQAIADENAQSGEAIGRYGAELIEDGMHILTHCNAGWLGLVDWGSALAPIYYAKRQGKRVFVYVDETRPRGQGASLTAWELMNEGIDCTIIADNAAGHFMQREEVDLVIVGADRIATNGDVANKIGTFEKAVLAKETGVPFFVAAPTSTIDQNTACGEDIPIEERSAEEVLITRGMAPSGEIIGVRTTPAGASARNPAFDVTPAKYIRGIITELGIAEPSVDGLLRCSPPKNTNV